MSTRRYLITLLCFILLFALILCAYIKAEACTKRQDTIHEAADILRGVDFVDSSPAIKALSDAWWAEQNDIQMLAVLIYNEAWCDCTERHRELVAAVVVNRVNSDLFPDSVYDVITQRNQYLSAYADMSSKYAKNAMADPDAWAECLRIATKALNGEVDCPEDVLFQANFKQGVGTYEVCKTSYSTSYFCYGA